MINFYMLIFLVLFCSILIFSCVISILESRFKLDLLRDKDFSRLKKKRIKRLELFRYRKTVYSNHQPIRKKISLNASEVKSTNIVAVVEDELEIVGYVGSFPHVIFVYPYSKENAEKLLSFVNEYGIQK